MMREACPRCRGNWRLTDVVERRRVVVDRDTIGRAEQAPALAMAPWASPQVKGAPQGARLPEEPAMTSAGCGARHRRITGLYKRRRASTHTHLALARDSPIRTRRRARGYDAAPSYRDRPCPWRCLPLRSSGRAPLLR